MYQLIKKNKDTSKLQKILNLIKSNYKLRGSSLYTKYIRNLYSITISTKGGIK